MEIMGHRGAAGLAPENTIPGFQKSLDLGVKWVEMDIRPNLDGELVLLHDKNLKRTTDGEGDINEISTEALKDIDAGKVFSPEFAGTRVPSLAELLENFHDSLNLNIEMKEFEDRVDEQITRLFELLDKYQLRHKVLISSFRENILQALREADSRVRLGIISGKNVDALKRVSTELDCEFVNPNSKVLSQQLVQWAHDNGKKIAAWTANDPEMVHLFMQVNVDYIVTDYPDMALKCLEENL